MSLHGIRMNRLQRKLTNIGDEDVAHLMKIYGCLDSCLHERGPFISAYGFFFELLMY